MTLLPTAVPHPSLNQLPPLQAVQLLLMFQEPTHQADRLLTLQPPLCQSLLLLLSSQPQFSHPAHQLLPSPAHHTGLPPPQALMFLQLPHTELPTVDLSLTHMSQLQADMRPSFTPLSPLPTVDQSLTLKPSPVAELLHHPPLLFQPPPPHQAVMSHTFLKLLHQVDPSQ
jgi:hypothetical protein